MRSSSRPARVRLDFRVDELEFPEGLIKSGEDDPTDFQIVVKRRFPRSSFLHEDFVLELRASDGNFLVTSVTGSENGLTVSGLAAPNSSGVYALTDGDGFTYDDLLTPASRTVFDNAGLFFAIAGPTGTISEDFLLGRFFVT